MVRAFRGHTSPSPRALLGLLLPLAVAGFEARDPAAGVEDLLLARVERVQFEQTSTWMLPDFLVLRVVNVFPQPQVTSVVTYSG